MSKKLGIMELSAARLGLAIGGSLSRESCNKLFGHIDALDKEIGYYRNKIDRLIDNVTQLEGNLRSAKETKKVVLPKEVAEAIDICRNAGLSEFAIITCTERVSSLFRDYSKSVLDALIVVRDYAWTVSKQGLLSALVNGYTVEEPPSTEERLRTELTPVIHAVLTELKGERLDVITEDIINKIMPITKLLIQEEE